MLTIIIALFGAIFGSFASALIPRLRAGTNFVSARSECPACHHELWVFDLFPIFSYLGLLGKCRYCGVKIPPYHFLLECSMAAMFALVSLVFIDPSLVAAGDLLHISVGIYLLIAAFVTVVFTAYDLLYMEIPDAVVLPFLGLSFLYLGSLHLLGLEISYMRDFVTFGLNTPLVQWMIGALPIFGFFLFLILITRGRGLGGWDLRIAVFMGFVGGAQIAWLGLFLSYIVGSVIWIGLLLKGKGSKTAIPFGPFLAIGLWTALVFHSQILEWYYSFLI